MTEDQLIRVTTSTKLCWIVEVCIELRCEKFKLLTMHETVSQHSIIVINCNDYYLKLNYWFNIRNRFFFNCLYNIINNMLLTFGLSEISLHNLMR